MLIEKKCKRRKKVLKETATKYGLEINFKKSKVVQVKGKRIKGKIAGMDNRCSGMIVVRG